MDLDFVAVVVQFAVESWMNTRQMIALEIIVHVRLPIALHLVGTPLKQLHLRERIPPDLFGQVAQHGTKRCSRVIQVHEDQVGPLGHSDWPKGELPCLKSLDALKFRRTDEFSVQAVGPAMVAAAKHFSRAAPLRWRARP